MEKIKLIKNQKDKLISDINKHYKKIGLDWNIEINENGNFEIKQDEELDNQIIRII